MEGELVVILYIILIRHPFVSGEFCPLFFLSWYSVFLIFVFFGVDISELLEEAKSCTEEKNVNWTQLGTKYGLTAANRGQQVKEVLAERGIPAACKTERPSRTPR